MKNQITWIFEDETVTSKTLSALILSKNFAKNFKILRFNINSESKSYLLGKYVGEQDFFSGIIFKSGIPFKAFTEGSLSIIRWIYLSNPLLLKSYKETLDSKIVRIEMPGFPLK